MYLLAIITVAAIPATGAQYCNMCNCQLTSNIIEMMNHVIQDEVNRILADEPCKLQCFYDHNVTVLYVQLHRYLL